MPQATRGLVDQALDAARDNDWPRALELFNDAAAHQSLDPDAFVEMGRAAFWLGDAEACIEARERAYAGYINEGREPEAARVALDIAEGHFHLTEMAQGMGWVHTAERLLERYDEQVEHGYLQRMLAVLAFEDDGDLERAQELADGAYEIAARQGSRDLQALTLHDQGRIRAARGDIEGGMALMDEAMVAAVSGELGSLYTGKIYCNMIDICEQLADYQRAGDWSDAAKRWCERAGHNGGFPGVCRVHRAEIMRLRGEWDLAEEEATRASRELGNFVDFAGEAFYEIGEIRFHLGDLDAARDSFQKAHALGRDPQPGLADLELALGKSSAAEKLIKQALKLTAPPLKRARMLPTQVEASLAVGDEAGAQLAVDELVTIARDYETPALQAYAARSQGLVALYRDDFDTAVTHLRQAIELWRRNGFPYLAARSRISLARAYRGLGSAEAADLEISAARAAFEDLGAVEDARQAAIMQRADESGERTTAGMMFTDIVDSTALINVIGDAAWEQLLRWHHRTLRALIGANGGQEIENTGDGLFAAFDDTNSAVTCAIDIQRRLHEQRVEQGFAPEIRIGLHAGEATAVGSSLAGENVHKTARICSNAGPGLILATSEFLHTLNPMVESINERDISLKGFSELVSVAEVTWT